MPSLLKSEDLIERHSRLPSNHRNSIIINNSSSSLNNEQHVTKRLSQRQLQDLNYHLQNRLLQS